MTYRFIWRRAGATRWHRKQVEAATATEAVAQLAAHFARQGMPLTEVEIDHLYFRDMSGSDVRMHSLLNLTTPFAVVFEDKVWLPGAYPECPAGLREGPDAPLRAQPEATRGVAEAAARWRAAWPDHCKACQGWGGAVSFQTHPYGATSAAEPLFDLCEAHERIETCHRCGQDGLAESGEGPCLHCGWNYDDGEPLPG